MASFTDLKTLLFKNLLNFKSFLALWINNDENCQKFSSEINSKMKKLVNSLKFWNGKFRSLKNDRFIIFTTFTADENVHISYIDMLKGLEKVTSLDNVEKIFLPENKNYLGVFFKDVDICLRVRNEFKEIENAYVVDVNAYLELLEVEGRMHYVPPFISNKQVGTFLSQYLLNLKIINVPFKELSGYRIESSTIAFRGVLKPNCNLDIIPHFQLIENNEILITVKGRSPICTKCRCRGHVKRDCELVYCNRCHLLINKIHDCQTESLRMSYASKVKTKTNDTQNSKLTIEPTDFDEFNSDNKIELNNLPISFYQKECTNTSLFEKQASLSLNNIPISGAVTDSKNKKVVMEESIGNNGDVGDAKIKVISKSKVASCSTDNMKSEKQQNKNDLCLTNLKSLDQLQMDTVNFDIQKIYTYSKEKVLQNIEHSEWGNDQYENMFSPENTTGIVNKDVSSDKAASDIVIMDTNSDKWLVANKRKFKESNNEQNNTSVEDTQNVKFVKTEELFFESSNLFGNLEDDFTDN